MAKLTFGKEKRGVQRLLLPKVKQTKIITLAGADLVNYLNLYPPTVKHVEIWENNSDVMLEQMMDIQDIQDREIMYRFGDIIHAGVDPLAFYDLDFCRTIRNSYSHVRKFKDCPFSATFSLHSCSIQETIRQFLSAVGENKVSDISYKHYNILKTNKNRYTYFVYMDTTTMINFFKL